MEAELKKATSLLTFRLLASPNVHLTDNFFDDKYSAIKTAPKAGFSLLIVRLVSIFNQISMRFLNLSSSFYRIDSRLH